jgi:hypothetical protein
MILQYREVMLLVDGVPVARPAPFLVNLYHIQHVLNQVYDYNVIAIIPHSVCAQQGILYIVAIQCHHNNSAYSIKVYCNYVTTIIDIPLKTFKIVVGSVGSVAVLLFSILTVIIIIAMCRRWLAHRHHGDRQLVERDEN